MKPDSSVRKHFRQVKEISRMKRRGASELAMSLMRKKLQKPDRKLALFDELLHAAYMVQVCTDCNYQHGFRELGELDWASEIRRLREEIFG